MPVMLVRGVGDCLSWMKQIVRSLGHHAIISSQDATLPATAESPQGKDAQNCSPIGRTRPLMAWWNQAAIKTEMKPKRSWASRAKHFRYVFYTYIVSKLWRSSKFFVTYYDFGLFDISIASAPAFQVHSRVRCLCDSCSKTCTSRTQRKHRHHSRLFNERNWTWMDVGETMGNTWLNKRLNR